MPSTRRWWAVVAAAALLVGCGGADCTAIGCGSGLLVSGPPGMFVPVTATVRACVDDACVDRPFSPALPIGSSDWPLSAGASNVTIAIDGLAEPTTSARFAGEVQFRKSQPNGPRCEPTCITASLTLHADGSITVNDG